MSLWPSCVQRYKNNPSYMEHTNHVETWKNERNNERDWQSKYIPRCKQVIKVAAIQNDSSTESEEIICYCR